MISMSLQNFVVPLTIMLLALLIDSIFGEPPDRFHPTAWMGKLITFLKPKLRSKNRKIEKLNGILLSVLVICTFSIPIYVTLFLIWQHFGPIVFIVISAVIFKLTFSIKTMKRLSHSIATSLEKGDIHGARGYLPRIVRRDPSKLDQDLILSATVESVGESTVDGITSPFFYFALLGVPGAIAFRVVNTLDSMVGYKDPENINIGWFSAKLDSILNFIPSRLTAGLMVISAALLKEDCRNSWRILMRDRNKTASMNAGWPMSAMAGALHIKLEKPDHYILGDNEETICHGHVFRALRMMELAVLLFLTLIVIPTCLVNILWGA